MSSIAQQRATVKGKQSKTETGVGRTLTVMMTGGGTAGHINPGLAVAAELKRQVPEANIVWVGTADRLEARLVPRAGIPIDFIRVSYLKGRGVIGKLKAMAQIPSSLWQSWRLLRRHKPDLVVGVGGFASGPVTLMAALTRRASAILEQNARPGLTNRILGKFVKRVFLSFHESVSWFKVRKTRVFGNPVRAELLVDQTTETTEHGSDRSVDRADQVHVLIFGGSQGAAVLNDHMPDTMARVREHLKGLHVRHGAGRGRGEAVQAKYGQVDWVTVQEYIDDMKAAYEWADFVICRSGASTVAELTVLGKPAMYVPFPHAADNHQEKNAQAVVAQADGRSGGLLVPQDRLVAEPPVEALVALLSDRSRLAEMSEAARAVGRPEAAGQIAEELLALV